VDLLTSDYNTHAPVASAYLTGLGVTELARINEQFDNALAKNLQALTDRGLYSSAIATAITARIERERTEAIGALNDRLNREKWENQHRIYQQQTQMRGSILDGRGKYVAMHLQNGQFLTDTRRQLALATMQARLHQAAGRMDVRDREEKLMAYQLDARNNLIIGLFSFMERREDSYPELGELNSLIAGLGDAGGGWVTP
jgi:hypothetical protein